VISLVDSDSEPEPEHEGMVEHSSNPITPSPSKNVAL